MVRELLADELRDIKLDDNRQVYIDDTKDLAHTEGVETVEQSLGIRVGNVARPLIGETFTESKFRTIATDIAEIVQTDEQIDNVRRVEITEIDSESNTISLTIYSDFNNDYEITVPVNA